MAKNKKIVSKNIYRLPFDSRLDFTPQLAPFHYKFDCCKYSVDFAMPEGTPVLAAADGLVSLVKDEYDMGGPGLEFADFCNYISIEHQNGEYTDYAHLMKGCKVKEGGKVVAGQVIGYSGLTGYTTYPHLHFSVSIWKKSKWQTILPRFNVRGNIIVLQSPKE